MAKAALNFTAIMEVARRCGYPDRDVPLWQIAELTGIPMARLQDLVLNGPWDHDGGMGCPPSIMEAP